MKKKVLLSSILVIALCLSLIAGSTFALFSSEKKIDVAVTAGNVNVTAELVEDTLKAWSRLETIDDSTDWVFANGGTVEIDDEGNLKIDKMSPGDNVQVSIQLTNRSDIAIKYQIAVAPVADGDATFVEKLNGTVAVTDADGNITNYAIQGGSTGWVDLAPDISPKDLVLTLSLPDTVGNEVMGQSAYFSIVVKAIQADGSADTVSNPAELADALANAQYGDTIEFAAGNFGTIEFDGKLEGVTLVFDADTDVKFNILSGAVLKNVTMKNLVETSDNDSSAYVDGGVINIKAGATVENLVIEDADFTGGSGGRSSAMGISEPTAEITFKKCKFGGTKYAVYGFSPVSVLTFDQCSFENLNSWVILMNGSDTVGAQLTIHDCTFDNCGGGIVKYLGGTQPDGAFTVFTNNTLTNSKGHDGKDAQWFTIPGATSTITVSGNTLDSAAWTPGTAQGLGK